MIKIDQQERLIIRAAFLGEVQTLADIIEEKEYDPHLPDGASLLT